MTVTHLSDTMSVRITDFLPLLLVPQDPLADFVIVHFDIAAVASLIPLIIGIPKDMNRNTSQCHDVLDHHLYTIVYIF